MKRSVVLLVMGLILIVALCGEAFSMVPPRNYIRPTDGGDDHTWGGEQDASGGVALCGAGYFTTGVLTLDIFLNEIILTNPKRFDANDSSQIIPDRISHQGERDDIDSDTYGIGNNKGR